MLRLTNSFFEVIVKVTYIFLVKDLDAQT